MRDSVGEVAGGESVSLGGGRGGGSGFGEAEGE